MADTTPKTPTAPATTEGAGTTTTTEAQEPQERFRKVTTDRDETSYMAEPRAKQLEAAGAKDKDQLTRLGIKSISKEAYIRKPKKVSGGDTADEYVKA